MERLGGLQSLEVKEVQLFPLDPTRKVYGCRYKNWNYGRKASPIVVWVDRTPKSSGYDIPAVRMHQDTPYEYTVNEDGVVDFTDALQEESVVHAGFTFRLFSESSLQTALRTVGFSTLAAMLPISLDDQAIADFLVEPLILATMLHLRESMLSEQSLYYSYSIQEQSHQLNQVHDNLEADVNRDRAALEKLIDSDLWFRYQGHAARRTSHLKDSFPFGVPWTTNGMGRGSRHE